MQSPNRSNLNSSATPRKTRPATMSTTVRMAADTGATAGVRANDRMCSLPDGRGSAKGRLGAYPQIGSFARRRSTRRPGVVLILVVAVLGILFVAGAALLTQVTFSSKNLDAMKVDRENLEAVAAAERIATNALAAGFLGRNGIPNSPESPLPMHKQGQPFMPCDDLGTSGCVLTLPTVAEIPGVHPWIGVTEPTTTDSGAVEWKLHTDTAAMVAGRPTIEPGRTAVDPADWTGNPQPVTATYRTANDAFSLAVLSETTPRGAFAGNDNSKYFQADADGDGVADSFEYLLPRDLLPTDVYQAVASRLRDPNIVGVNGIYSDALPDGRSENDLFVALRIVPHGAMANLNDSATSIRRTALRYSYPEVGGEPRDANLFAGAPYRPESNEWLLRNRGIIPPQQLPMTRLIENMTEELLRPHALGGTIDTTLLAQWSNRRWWPYDTADVAASNAAWRTMMRPQGPSSPATAAGGSGNLLDRGDYDVAHNVTTISHDDLLVRGGPDAAGSDIVSALAAADGFAPWDDSAIPPANKHAWDNYPFHLDAAGDRRLGRIKLSLPEMDRWLREKGLSLADLGSAVPEAVRVRRTIQEAFLLMLSQRPPVFDNNGVIDPILDNQVRAVEAAMLTANLIDFADIDVAPTDTPTPVSVFDLNGDPVPDAADPTKQYVVYGFERQPFITEIYTKTAPAQIPGTLPAQYGADKNQSVFAIELYNPYDSPVDLSTYELTDLEESQDPNTTTNDPSGVPLPRMKDRPLGSVVIPGNPSLPLNDPSRFVVFCLYGDSCPDGGDSLGSDGIDKNSRIALQRVLTVGGVERRIVVDEMRASNLAGGDVREAAGMPEPKLEIGKVEQDTSLPASEVSIQRDTSVGTWRFTVPRSTKSWGVGRGTPGLANSANAIDPSIYPVHVDVANAGSFTYAYPTTGTMLLLSRMAHVWDPTAANGTYTPATSPFNRLDERLVGFGPLPENAVHNIASEFDQIDNGRMPVFDLYALDSATNELRPPRYHTVPDWNSTATAHVAGRSDGLEALPWGQWVFDYFTAIALFPCPDPNDTLDPTCSIAYPRVDQEGLRVSGRIDINTAPWRVLSGLPMVSDERFDDTHWNNSTYPAKLQTLVGVWPTMLGDDLAQGIVAYREARNPWDFTLASVTNYENARDPHGTRDDDNGSEKNFHPRHGYGFLTVGELLNVRVGDTLGTFTTVFDRQTVRTTYDGSATQCFEKAVANLVLLSDWVTTKSHVFTVYGVIRGAYVPPPESGVANYSALQSLAEQSKTAVDQRAIRFQTTVDRLPMFFGADRPERIGAMTVESYSDLRSN